MTYVCPVCFRVAWVGHECGRSTRIVADDHGAALTLSLASDDRLTASSTARMLGGTLVRYGAYGRTSSGRLRVRPGALRFPDDMTRVILTREHDRGESRGVLAAVHDDGEQMRVQLRPADGPDGDAAITEARDGSRAGLSFDVVDATIEGDEITDALVIAIGQVGIPAYDDGRIDSIAASINPTQGDSMTPEERARLAELLAMNSRNQDQETEFQALSAQAVAEAANGEPSSDGGDGSGDGSTTDDGGDQATAGRSGTQVAASLSAVPSGAPAPTSPATTQDRPGGAFARFADTFAQALRPGNPTRMADITAALADITHGANSATIEAPAWSGELWSGLVYEPQFSDLFNRGDLTNWEGKGWRFTKKLAIQDYAGDKAAIPTDTIGTEASGYEAARMAVGVDIDRKFFDFPNSGFVTSLFEQVRESWEIKLDAKLAAYALSEAVAARVDERIPFDGATNPLIGAQDSLLKAVAVAVRSLKRRRVGRATFVYVNDDDYFTLFSITQLDVPAFLKLLGVEPENIRSSEDIPQGTVLAGVKQAATVRTLPGSPIRVEAQNLTQGGIDEAFFGYWAIEEHHKEGIAKATFTP